MVFDFAGQSLYITTSTGIVNSYNLATQTLGPSYNLGGSLNGLDIARDNSYLLVAQNGTGVSQGSFQRVDLPSGTITNINYTRASGETGAWDVAIGSNGLALATTQFGGSGWVPLHQIDPSTNSITTRTDAPSAGFSGQVRQNTQIQRSADGSRFYLLESNISSGPIFTYSAKTNTFGPSAQDNAFNDFASAAVNRNGSLLGTRVFGQAASLDTAPNFGFVHSFNGIDSGVAFDGVREIFYGVSTSTSQIIAYDTNTFAELFRLSIGENLNGVRAVDQFSTGELVASPDGRYLALETPQGIRLFAVPEPGTSALVCLALLLAFGATRLPRGVAGTARK
ncbi:MAG: hypothetical protein ACJ8KX_13545 [Chthoniobacterales bacterium]